MTKPTAGRARCLLLLAPLVLIPALVLTAVLGPWASAISELDAEIATRQDQSQRYQRLLATLPGMRAELDRVLANQELKAFYFDAQTSALAGAQLQREVQEMVQTAGGRLISTQILPSAAAEQPQRVSIRAQLQGDVETLLEVLHRIEQARPFLFVDQISVRATQRRTVRRSAARGAPAAQQEGQLTVRLDVFGYALGQAG
ncbi:MAG: type II secretion system protein GspM [Chromatiaceae bacterium]|nr:type II secretion system protein GspM [Chromatiaceae bacterium]